MNARRSIGYAGTIDHVERMRSSVNGNPRYRVFLADGRSFPTAPDAMWAWNAESREWRQCAAWFALEPCRLKSDAWQIAYARNMFPAVVCAGCGRSITREDGRWVDPDASGDDRVWRETCEGSETLRAEHAPRVWFIWHGGANYSLSGSSAIDVETAEHVSDVLDVMTNRYLNRGGFYPCVGDDSSAWVFLSDPRDGGGDTYPDFIISRAAGADGGEDWHSWTVSPS